MGNIPTSAPPRTGLIGPSVSIELAPRDPLRMSSAAPADAPNDVILVPSCATEPCLSCRIIYLTGTVGGRSLRILASASLRRMTRRTRTNRKTARSIDSFSLAPELMVAAVFWSRWTHLNHSRSFGSGYSCGAPETPRPPACGSGQHADTPHPEKDSAVLGITPPCTTCFESPAIHRRGTAGLPASGSSKRRPAASQHACVDESQICTFLPSPSHAHTYTHTHTHKTFTKLPCWFSILTNVAKFANRCMRVYERACLRDQSKSSTFE